MDRWKEKTRLTLGVTIGAIRVIDEPRGVSDIRRIDADAVVEGVCVLSSYIISEEPSKGYQKPIPTGVEIVSYCLLKSTDVGKTSSPVYSGAMYRRLASLANAVDRGDSPMMNSSSRTDSKTAMPKPHSLLIASTY